MAYNRAMQVVRVLFVCLGNVCRSPSAEGVLRSALREAGLQDRVDVDSAGTGGHFAGRAPDPRAQAAARRRGYEIGGLRARQVTAEDLARFDLVFAMDEQNLADLQALSRAEDRAEVGLLLAELGSEEAPRSVPDPFYGGAGGFERMLDLIEGAVRGLLVRLRADYGVGG